MRSKLVVGTVVAVLAVAVPALPAGAAPLPAAAPAGADTLDGTPFLKAGYRPQDVAAGLRPWRRMASVPKVDARLTPEGVNMRRQPDGTYRDHPVGQATYALMALETWRRTGDPVFLQRARANADRLIQQHVEARGAWWYPYDWDFQLGTSDVLMEAPWYSGMSQGEVLSLFSQLSEELAGRDREAATAYRDAADSTFQSLRVGPGQHPWVAMVDAGGHYWAQEYPQDPPAESDFTYNGFGFTALGLWDYWHLSLSPEAADLFDASVTTLTAFAPVVRNTHWASSYSLRNDRPHVNYHVIHTDQLLQLSWLSGRSRPALLSDVFSGDYPDPHLKGKVLLAAGTHTLRTFAADGSVTAQRTVSLRSPLAVSTVARTRVLGRGIHFRLAQDPYRNWYVAEVPGRSYLDGFALVRSYHPARTGTLKAGRTVTLLALDAAGDELRRRQVTPSVTTRLRVSRSAVVLGRRFLRVADGPYAGTWVLASFVQLS